MALVEPYPLAFLSAILAPVSECSFDLLRFEEASGSGSGQRWAAELADPLWQVTLPLSPRRWSAAREINAKVFALGTTRSFMFADGSYRPAGGGIAGTGVTVGAVGADRDSLSLSGLPLGYQITAGDRLSIVHSAGRYYFGMFAETVTASAGSTAQIAIEPPLPFGIAAGATVAIDRPLVRVTVPGGNFTPFRDNPGRLSSGASLTMVQKL